MDWLEEPMMIVATVTVEGMKGSLIRSNSPSDYEDFVSWILQVLGDVVISSCTNLKNVLKTDKCDVTSSKLRETGNRLFKKDDLEGFEQALQLYSKCIAYASPNGQELAKGYSNRSAVLLKLNRPKESLEDIVSALNANHEDQLKQKLYSRMGECYSTLATRCYIEAKFWLDKVPQNDSGRSDMEDTLEDYSEEDYEDTIDREPTLPKIQSPSEKYECASDAIELVYSKSNGRKVQATRDIQVDEVLILQKPYLSFPGKNYFHLHCSHCLQQFFAGIPCDKCVNIMYCSEKCKLSAWNEYHEIECSVHDIIMQYDSWDIGGPCVRLLLIMCHEAGGLQQLKERVKKFENDSDKTSPEELFKKLGLESVLACETHVEKFPDEQLRSLVVIALRNLFYLATHTNFMGMQYSRRNISDVNIVKLMSENANVKFVGGLLIRLAQTCLTNSEGTSCRIPGGVNRYNSGIELTPLQTWIKRSCHYNATSQSIKDFHVVPCVLPTKKGDEIYFSNCNSSWIRVPKQVRLLELQKRFYINSCSCIACKENWPTLERLQSYKARIKSPEMKGKLNRGLSMVSQLRMKLYCGNANEKDMNELKRMINLLYQGVNLPCRELSELWDSIIVYYIVTGNTSKMKRLHLLSPKSVILT